MGQLDWTTNLVFILILFHLAVGFGYLMYKLSPTKKDKDEKEDR